MSVKAAVILAAGSGERIRDSERGLPKPLVVLGGLPLLERSLLNLSSSGIERFRVVLGYRAEEIQRALENSPRLKKLKIEYLLNPEYEKGNGSSLARGTRGLGEAFLLTMADHLFGQDTIKQFVDKALKNPTQAQLATDTNIPAVFDLPDATKVLSRDRRIVKISKELAEYNEIDTGLFYFPAATLEKIEGYFQEGAHSVSEIVARLNESQGFFTTVLEKAFWQDVDTPEMKREAEKRLFRSLIKETDGPVSKRINRPFSLFVSRFLIKWNVRPNTVTTFVFLLSLVACYFATSTSALYIALAGLIFQIASILDGCDGEIARLTFQGTEMGAWYDTLTDNIRYGLFFCALGVSGYRASGDSFYLWAIAIFALILTHMVSMNVSFLKATKSKGTGLVVTAQVEKLSSEKKSIWDRYVVSLRVLVKQDVSALIVMFLCFFNLPQIVFWVGLVGVTAMTLTVARALKAALPADSKAQPKLRNLVFYILGFLIFAWLLKSMDLRAISQSLSELGSKVFLAFAVAPAWFFFNAMSLHNLLRQRVPVMDLLYNQTVGEALNVLIPMAGLGGEPYKTKHLTKWVPLDDATQVIVTDKLLHILSGNLFTALTLAFTLLWVPINDLALKSTLVITTVVVTVITLLMTFLTLSKAPSKFTGQMLKRFKLLAQVRESHLSLKSFGLSLTYKMLGRFPQLIEAYIIFKLLGFAATPDQVVAVTALISASAMIFFFIPQGLGVNEGGVIKAFSILGLSTSMGATFGIIRRARVVFWALAGILLYVTVALVQKGRETWRSHSH